MNALKRKLASSLAVVVAGVGLALPTANAATVGGYAGLPNQSSQASCFSETFGTVKNNGTCGSAALAWEIPLYTNAVGNYDIIVTTTCNVNIRCEEFFMESDGTWPQTATRTMPPVAGPSMSSQSWAMDTDEFGPDVHTDGYIYAACWIPPGCSWDSVNWFLFEG